MQVGCSPSAINFFEMATKPVVRAWSYIDPPKTTNACDTPLEDDIMNPFDRLPFLCF